MLWSFLEAYHKCLVYGAPSKPSLRIMEPKGPFGWAFEPAFAFVKAKSQPKGPKATSAFAQKQLFS